MRRLLPLLFLTIISNVNGQVCIPNTNSLSFDGFSSYVSFPANSALDITDSISIEAWINADSWGFTSAQNTIVCKHGWSANEGGYVLRAGGTGELSFNIGADSSGVNLSWQEIISSPGTLQLNTWYHVAGTFDGTNIRIYINGSLAGTKTLNSQCAISPSPSYHMKIGRLSDSVQPETRYWSGMIDEVRVWHRVLDPTEIIANMSKHIDPITATDLVCYWRMNDGTGTSIADLGTSNITGTLMNTTWSTDVPFSDGPPVPTITSGGPYLYSSSSTNNQWNLNGIPIPNANFLSYVPTQNGIYTVTVTDSLGCSVTSAPYVVTTLGIKDISLINQVKIQNLNDGYLHVISPSEILSKIEIKIFDSNGKLISDIEKGKLKDEIDVKKLSAGMYVVLIKVGNTINHTKIVLD